MHAPSPDSYSQFTDQFVRAITAWAIKDALGGISNPHHSAVMIIPRN